MGELSRRQALAAFGGAAVLGGLAAGAFSAAHASAAVGGGAATRASRPGTLLWRQQGGPGGSGAFSGILAGNGMVYASNSLQANLDCESYALDAATGRLAWRARGPLPGDAGDGAVFGFEITDGGKAEVVALSSITGRTAWTYGVDRQWLEDGSYYDAGLGWLAYAGDLVYITSDNPDSAPSQPTVRALDARTGRRAWTASPVNTGQDPAVADGVLYMVSNGRVIALRGATGAQLWQSAHIGAYNMSALWTVDGVVCGNYSLTSSSPALEFFALDGATGAMLWQIGEAQAAELTDSTVTATSGGMVYFSDYIINPQSSDSTMVWARYARSGKLAWSRNIPGNPQLANGNTLYVTGTDSANGGNGPTLVALAAATGDTLWSYQLAADVNDVAADGDVVYAIDVKGSVYALQA